jgi:hypothetical protein
MWLAKTWQYLKHNNTLARDKASSPPPPKAPSRNLCKMEMRGWRRKKKSQHPTTRSWLRPRMHVVKYEMYAP